MEPTEPCCNEAICFASQWSGPGLSPRAGAETSGTASEGFDELQRLAAIHEFDTVVVVFPFFRNLSRYAMTGRHDSVAAKARQRGLPLLDLLQVYREAAEQEDVCSPCCVVHPNEKGHAIAARAIAEHLRRLSLLHAP